MKIITITYLFILGIHSTSSAQKLPPYDYLVDNIAIENSINNYLDYWIQQDEVAISKIIDTNFISRKHLRKIKSGGTILSFTEFMQSAPESSIKWYIDDTIHSNEFATAAVRLITNDKTYRYTITLDRINDRWTISSHDFENRK